MSVVWSRLVSLNNDTFWRVVLRFSFRCPEEVEDTRVDDSMLADTHVMTAVRDQFTFEIRNEATSPG